MLLSLFHPTLFESGSGGIRLLRDAQPRKLFSVYVMVIMVAAGFMGLLMSGTSDDQFNSDAAVLVVDKMGGGNYTTIQAAINNANSGDTIHVWAGTYNETPFITKSLTLIGNGSDDTHIVGSGGESVVVVTANWFNISGFSITHNGTTYWSRGVDISYSNHVRIEDCDVSNVHIGIYLWSSWNIFIENCTLSNNDAGILVDYSNPVSILYCNIHHNLNGTIIHNSQNTQIHHNNIYGNTYYGINNTFGQWIVNATFNWWGHSTGPYDGSDDTGGWYNPSGQGDNVSNFVLYHPWLTSPSNHTTNYPPTIFGTHTIIGYVSVYSNTSFNASDLDGDNLTWGFMTNAQWLNLGVQGFTTWNYLYGTPSPNDVGEYWGLLWVDDGNGGNTTHNITITVYGPGNYPPVLYNGSVSPTTGNTSTMFTYSVHYSDADGDAPIILHAVIDGNYYPMSYITGNNTTGALYRYQTTLTNGTHNYYFWTYSGYGGQARLPSTGHYLGPVVGTPQQNNPPTIYGVDVLYAHVGMIYNNSYNATDLDGDNLTWGMYTNASWLHLGITGMTSWNYLWGTPSPNQVGAYWVHLWVHDGNGGFDGRNFTITVLAPTNHPPQIFGADITYTLVNQFYNNTYNATDLDQDQLIWGLQTNAAWLHLGITGPSYWNYIYGTPNTTGVFGVHISVSDGNGGVVWRNFTITVHTPQNSPPSIYGVNLLHAHVNQLYNNSYNATDPDGDPLVWTLYTNAWWLSLGIPGTTSWNYIHGTPSPNALGNWWVHLWVSDGNGGSDSRNFTITVYNQTNAPPSLVNGLVSPSSGTTSTLFTYTVTYSDPDGDFPYVIRVIIDGQYHWMTYVSGDNTTGALYQYQTTLGAGTHNYYFWTYSGYGGQARLPTSGHFAGPSVIHLNQAPTIHGIDTTTAYVSQYYNNSYNATDPDNDPLTWGLTTNATWLNLGITTTSNWNYIYGTPSSTGSVTPSSGTISTNFTYSVFYSDPDGDAPIYMIVSIDGIGHQMTKVSGDYLNGALYQYQTTLSSGNHSYHFWTHAQGGQAHLPATGDYSGPTVSEPGKKHELVLSNGHVTPTIGTPSTVFTYYVTYSDADGDAPNNIRVVIDNKQHKMTYVSGSFTSGALYKYQTSLCLGYHNFYFWTVSGYPGRIDYPSNTTFSGPLVTQPNTLPVINGTNILNAFTGLLYSNIYTGYDPDGGAPTWSFNSNAHWLVASFNAYTMGITLWGTPSDNDAGLYHVSLSLSDTNGGIVWRNFTLDVIFNDEDGDGLGYSTEALLGTDPEDPDTDSDGLDDGYEDSIGTNPLKKDTDIDGLDDDEELELGTDPKDPDTDDDGILDGAEVKAGTSPLDKDNDGIPDLEDDEPSDSDNDGIPDSKDPIDDRVDIGVTIIDHQASVDGGVVISWAVHGWAGIFDFDLYRVLVAENEDELQDQDENEGILEYKLKDRDVNIYTITGLKANTLYHIKVILVVGDNEYESQVETVVTPSTTSKEAGSSIIDSSPLFLLVGLIICMLVLFGSASRSENFLLMMVTPLAGMTPKKEKHNPEIRGQIVGVIQAIPGVHYRRIKETLNMGNGTCAYHLQRLERDGLIRSERDGLFKRYYPMVVKKKETSILALSEIRQNIIKILSQSPGLSLTELSYLLEQDKQKVTYHLKKLVKGDMISKVKNPSGYTMYYVREKYAPPSELESNGPGPTEEVDLES